MDGNDVMNVILMFSQSQGSYGRLYSALMSADEDERAEFIQGILDTDPQGPIDVIMAIEN